MRSADRDSSLQLRAVVGSIARQGIAWLHAFSGQSARDRAHLDGSCAGILMYHRVLPLREARRLHVEPGMFVTPETFTRHLEWLARHFSVLPLHDIVARLRAGERLPPGACAITFDDGWRDNHDHALPALAARRMPATIFVVTDRVGTSGAFWPDEVCRRLSALDGSSRRSIIRSAGLDLVDGSTPVVLAALKGLDEKERERVFDAIRRVTTDPVDGERELLDWDELARLAEQRVDIESHAASHAILTAVSREQAADELARSLARLRQSGHARHALLAYPSGAFDREVVELARAAGYRAAFTTQIGLASGGDDSLCQPRLAVHDDISRTRAEFLRWVPGPARAVTRERT